jgi:hypothetical protein
MLAAVSEAGGLDGIIDRIANGETLTAVAGSIGVGRVLLSDWLHGDPERQGRLFRARQTAASALAEQSLKIADEVGPLDVQKARLQVDTRRWLASRYDPATYGDQKAQVEINIGQLHVDALRKVNAEMSNSLRVNEIAGKLT